jgi:AraC-like DNA-binding protein
LSEDFFLYLEKLLTGEVKGKLTLPTSVIANRTCWESAILLHEAIINDHDQLSIDELIVALFAKIEILQIGKVLCRGFYDPSNARFKDLLDFMRARLGEDISLENLADIARCSSYHVIRLFKNQVGMPPHAYLIQLRLERARELIDSGQSIVDAAFLAGFSDQSHLTRRFKERYGLTPGRYDSQKLS